MKRARVLWTVVFLGTTLAAIVMECVAGLWHPAGWTIPWTEYLARYVPWPIQLVAYVALAVWLPFHFWRHDHLRQAAYRRGYRAAQLDRVARGMSEPAPGKHVMATACSHGFVWGHPSGHICGEMPSDGV